MSASNRDRKRRRVEQSIGETEGNEEEAKGDVASTEASAGQLRRPDPALTNEVRGLGVFGSQLTGEYDTGGTICVLCLPVLSDVVDRLILVSFSFAFNRF